MKKLILIDAHALIHRTYHALPKLTTRDGAVVNAVYGFSTILIKVMDELKPDFIIAAFDMPQATFRHAQFESYKAHRKKAEDDLVNQFTLVKEVLESFNIPQIEMAGFEADDIIGTIAEKL